MCIYMYICICIYTFLQLKNNDSKNPKQSISKMGKRHEQIFLQRRYAKDMNRYFSKEDMQMANKYRERCSTPLIIREIQIKITVRYPLIPISTALIKNTKNNQRWQGCGETGTLVHC